MPRPESYQEMDAYLNSLSAWMWKGILFSYNTGAVSYPMKTVVAYLRRYCAADLVLWKDEELLGYLSARNLQTDFTPTQERM